MRWKFWKPKPEQDSKVVYIENPLKETDSYHGLKLEIARLEVSLRNETFKREMFEEGHKRIKSEFDLLVKAIELAQTIQFRGKVNEISPGE